ncbi:hypothetical protein BVY02_00280 [bacterium J17]|nr:hypothetical protein BVY02_00280 [bacterium J17]
MNLLQKRSKVELNSSPVFIAEPEIRPDQGHGSQRLSVGAGSRDNQLFSEIEWRPVYHGLLDRDEGFVRGSAITFFDFRFRHYETNNLRVEEVKAVEAISLTPHTAFVKPLSWRLNISASRKRLRDSQEPIIAKLDGGVGYTKELGKTALLFGLAEAEANWSGDLVDNYALGAGAQVGAVVDILPIWRMIFRGRLLRFGLGDDHNSKQIHLSQRFSLTRNQTIEVSLSRTQEHEEYLNEGMIRWHVYFRRLGF